MELRHLRYFVTVADFLHFGRAAQELQIAQPSLSHQILQLEAELQTKLFERTKRRVRLTDSGARFLEQTRQILEMADQAALIARTGRSRGQDLLRVAFGYWTDVLKVCAAIKRFKAMHPEVHVELHSMNVVEQITALREGRIDVAFARPPIVDHAISSEFFLSEPFVVAMSRNHRLRRHARVPIAALKEEPIIMPPRQDIPLFYDLTLKLFQDAGFTPKVQHEVDYPTMVLGLVAMGVGISLVPASIGKIQFAGVVFSPLQPSLRVLETAVAWQTNKATQPVNEFLKVVRAVASSSRRPRARAARKS